MWCFKLHRIKVRNWLLLFVYRGSRTVACGVNGGKTKSFWDTIFNCSQKDLTWAHLKKTLKALEAVSSKLTFTNKETAIRGVSWKKVFLEISQNSQENTCARVSFLIKL